MSQEIRCFISIDVDDDHILSEVTSVVSTLLGLGGDLKAVERENIHLTLKFLGNVSPSKLQQTKTALDRVKFAPFKMEIKGAGAFPSLARMNVIWVGIEEGWTQVQQIYEQTESFLGDLGFRREARAFSPHITVARVRSGRRSDEIASVLRKLEDKSFGAFLAESVRLKQSTLLSSGPEYSTLFEVKAQTA